MMMDLGRDYRNRNLLLLLAFHVLHYELNRPSDDANDDANALRVNADGERAS